MIIVKFIIVVMETINQLNKIYLNQNRRTTTYCRFQYLSLSLNTCRIKWRKVRVSMYVKVLHSPIIIFLLKFLLKGVTKSLFHHCHKKKIPLKRHLNILCRLIFIFSLYILPQRILWRYHKRFWGPNLIYFWHFTSVESLN